MSARRKKVSMLEHGKDESRTEEEGEQGGACEKMSEQHLWMLMHDRKGASFRVLRMRCHL